MFEDKYGFSFHRMSRIANGNIIHTTSFSNNKTSEFGTFEITFSRQDKFLDDSLVNRLKKELQGKDIVETFLYLLNELLTSKEIIFDKSDRIFNLIDSLPNSIIISKAAVKELLSGLPKENKKLFVCIATHIKTIREEIEALEAEDDVLDSKMNILSEEFEL